MNDDDVEDESAALGLKTLLKHAKGTSSLCLVLDKKFALNCYTFFWTHLSGMHSTIMLPWNSNNYSCYLV